MTIVFSLASGAAGGESPHDDGTMDTKTPDLDYIFDVLTGDEQKAAIAMLIERIKENRRVSNESDDFFGIADNSLALSCIYTKMKHLSEAGIEMGRCVRYVKKIDKITANDPIAQNNPELKKLKVSMEWNRLVVDTALLTVSNESEMSDVEQMPMGPERRESTYAVVQKLVHEQANCLKIGNLHQCLKIEIHCISILRGIDNEEAGSVVKTRELFEKHMVDAESMILKYGPKLDQESVEAIKNLKWIWDLQKSLQ
jgi:hypothetical protein